MNLSCTFSNLRSGYTNGEVLHGVSGSFPAGSVTAFIGPNGGGKSTLLKVLAGFLPYGGSATLMSREINSFSRHELGRTVSFLSQGADVRTEFSVRDVIAFGRLPWIPLLSPLADDDARHVDDAARRMGVESLLDRPVAELSGGERQRVFLAMVAAQGTQYCLLDEPTSAMDPLQTRLAFRFIRGLAVNGVTVVVAAHDLNAALSAADFFLAIKDGTILASGRADDLNEEILEVLYDVKFCAFTSQGGEKVWHPAPKNF